MKKSIQKSEKELADIESQLVQEALKLPNKTHPDSPVGDEKVNKLLRTVDARVEGFNDELDFTHVEIGKEFDLLDFQNASKLTGNKFVFLKN